MSRVIHFDLSADDPERAARFYKSVFGWKVEKWQGPSDYWLMTTGDETEPGITGGVALRGCGVTMKKMKLSEADLFPDSGIKVVPAGVLEIMQKAQTRWFHIRP